MQKSPIFKGEKLWFGRGPRVGFVLDKKLHICYIIPRKSLGLP